MSKKKPKIFDPVRIVDIAAKGQAVGKTEDGQVIFLEGAVPGDVVQVQSSRKRKGAWQGRILKYHSYASERRNPECEHFGVCGGCKWQHLDYSAQLQYKAKEVEHNLRHIGKLENISFESILPAPSEYFYRNKMEFSFSNQRWLTATEIQQAEKDSLEKNGLGFHKPRMWDKVVDIQKCHLQADPSNEIRNYIRAYALEHQLSFFDPRAQQGLLRTLMIRNTLEGAFMVLIQFYEDQKPQRDLLLQSLQERFPQIQSLLYCVNQKANDTLYDQEIFCFSGTPYITEHMEGLAFKINAKSFFQTNSAQALALYQQVRDFAALKPTDRVYDLYTGTGTIALFMARHCHKVVGIESVPEAIDAAKENALENGIDNCFFEVGDMKDCFNEAFIERHGAADVIITDPPRNGMHPDVVQQLIQSSASKIVYVSCNSATQARDLALMKDSFEVIKSQAVDMFPQTHHVENIVLLVRK